jgi:RimJ/RimL family protein N-acetyltransferase
VTFSILPFRAEHAKAVSDPASEPGMLGVLSATPGYFAALEACGTAFSAFADGAFLGCAGFVKQHWGTAAEVWAWVLPEGKKHPVVVHKMLHRYLKQMDAEGVLRVSCVVRKGNRRAYRWMKLLGFKRNAPLKKYGPGGTDFFLYDRVRG